MTSRILYYTVLFFLLVSTYSKSTFSEKDVSDADIDKTEDTDDDVIKTVEAPVTLSDPKITILQEENAAVAADSYSLYKQLMEVKNQLTSSNNTMKEPPAVSSLKAALSLLYDSLIDGVFGGLFPHVERQRREATDEKRAYLDMAVTAVGAVMGKQNCSRMIACRTGRYVGAKVPSAGLLVMMAENFIPQSFRNWFGIVKTSIMSTNDDNYCDHHYMCSLVH